MKKRLPTLRQLKSLMKKIAKENGIEEQVNNSWCHSTVVWRLANNIARLAKRNGYQINFQLLKVGCYFHDIGRMITGGKGSKELRPAIYHFYEGYQLMKQYGYPQLARICVSHAAGVGLDKQTNKGYGFISRNFFPRTIEEKIIAYADARTSYKKGEGPYIGSFNKAYNRFKKYRGVGKRLKENQLVIQKITKGKIR